MNPTQPSPANDLWLDTHPLCPTCRKNPSTGEARCSFEEPGGEVWCDCCEECRQRCAESI